MQARFIKQIGWRGRLRIYWESVRLVEEQDSGRRYECLGGCPNSYGRGKNGIHNAYLPIDDRLGDAAQADFGDESDYTVWPTACAYCAAEVPTEAPARPSVGESGTHWTRQVFVERLFDTPSGKPEPGDLYWLRGHEDRSCWHWDNCDGMHLHGIVPNGDRWDIDSRASNCTLKDDRLHRCWVRHGRPEDGNVHVDKNGLTCNAGGGSIDTGGWHGHLKEFQWVP